MKLADYAKPGDWLLFYPKKTNILGKIITRLTFGKVSHAAIYFGDGKIFETDGDLFKAGYADAEQYDGRHIAIIRVKGLRGKPMMEACEKYKDSPYSYWDIATNGLFFWLAAPLRKNVVQFLGTKKFMICSELVARITYEITGRKELHDYEGLTPEDLLGISKMYPEEYQLRCDYNPEA